MRLKKYDSREEWLKDRKGGIGSSDAAGIMGMSQYSSPLKVWLDKTSDVIPDVDNRFTKAGRYLETPIAEWFKEETGLDVQMARDFVGHEEVTVLHQEHDFIRATPDGWVTLEGGDGLRLLDRDIRGRGLLEIKNTSTYKAADWDEKVPPMVYAQVQHQLLVLDCKWAFVAVLIGGNELRWFFVEADAEMQEEMLSKEITFWTTYVLTEEQPAAQSEVDKQYLAMLYPEEEEDSEVHLSAEAAELDEEIILAQAEIKRLEQVVKDSRTKIIAELGRHAVGVLPDGTKYTHKTQTRKGYVREVAQWTGRVLRRIKKKK
jgi:putative phage-type endonuclease